MKAASANLIFHTSFLICCDFPERNQRLIQNFVKHLRCGFLADIIDGYAPRTLSNIRDVAFLADIIDGYAPTSTKRTM